MSEEIKKKMLLVSAILFKNNVPVNEAKEIGSFIEELQQENQQLKEQLENASKNYTKYIQQRDNVLDEIREYIDKAILGYSNWEGTEPLYLKDDEIGKDLLQILDKVKE
jgi:flagellar hook-basal body complex protein FliE